MKKYAIDIVLLPPDNIHEKAVEINQELDTEQIDFSSEDTLPHLTLLMGCLAAEDIEKATAKLQQIAQSHSPLSLHLTKVVQKGAMGFDIERTPGLQKLHEVLIEEFKPILTYDASPVMFYKPGEVKEDAVNYVNQFLEKYSRESFWPHITLGYGDYPEKELNEPFTAFRMALCHLGKHCTCRQIFAEVSLGS
jgi:2'-5' RNA ligase